MPEASNGRDKVLNFLEGSDVNFVDIGVMYGMPKQDVTNYLTGNLKNTPAANKLVLRIISDFKIR